jgi:SAM-dependent methyltransferase
VEWAKEQNPDANIVAIEPDKRVTDYPVINMKLEDMDLPSDYFDFVYCMQTLEHVDSASDMLRQLYDCLEPGGRLFLEVPNIEVIDYPLNIEEFFIDKHNFHFGRDVLCSYMEFIGFSLVSVNDDNLNIRILATKGLPNKLTATSFSRTDSQLLIKQYAEIIQRNRAKLPAVVEKIKRIMQNQKVAFWGANTIFDLMVKYGGLEPSEIGVLVDSYLSELIDNIHGVPVCSPEILRVFQPDVCIILARHSSDEIVKSARKFNIRNVIKFSDLLESV